MLDAVTQPTTDAPTPFPRQIRVRPAPTHFGQAQVGRAIPLGTDLVIRLEAALAALFREATTPSPTAEAARAKLVPLVEEIAQAHRAASRLVALLALAEDRYADPLPD